MHVSAVFFLPEPGSKNKDGKGGQCYGEISVLSSYQTMFFLTEVWSEPWPQCTVTLVTTTDAFPVQIFLSSSQFAVASHWLVVDIFWEASRRDYSFFFPLGFHCACRTSLTQSAVTRQFTQRKQSKTKRIIFYCFHVVRHEKTSSCKQTTSLL